MKFFWRLLLLAAIAALGCWLWTILFPNEERQIRRQLTELARTASFDQREGSLERFGKIAELSGSFTPDLHLYFDVPRQGKFSLDSRDQIIAIAARLRDYTTALTVDFLDMNVVLGRDHESATVTLTARAATPTDRDLFVQEMKFFLKKLNRRWLIQRIETVKTLSRSTYFEYLLPHA